MPTVCVTSSVCVKIPVVIQRMERIDENSEVADIAMELISRTALHRESERTHREGEIAATKMGPPGGEFVFHLTVCVKLFTNTHTHTQVLFFLYMQTTYCGASKHWSIRISQSELVLSPGVLLLRQCCSCKCPRLDFHPMYVLSTCSITIECSAVQGRILVAKNCRLRKRI